jgi:Arc/MetJ-type ribon-helix-helix transcriptional regulator
MTNEGVKRMKAYNSRIAVRLSDTEKEKAEQLIRERKFKNLSEGVRASLTELLKKYEDAEQ